MQRTVKIQKVTGKITLEELKQLSINLLDQIRSVIGIVGTDSG